ncbi:MAG: hypothetical protein M3P43_18135, partial [Actinomycetota bacterium]|nr:hypothetical protein [Actinomycetota bacterium]
MAETPQSFPDGSFLASLESADRSKLVREGRPMSLPAGATLLFEGDLSDHWVSSVAVNPGIKHRTKYGKVTGSQTNQARDPALKAVTDRIRLGAPRWLRSRGAAVRMEVGA